MKAILIIFDSLSKSFLPPYGNNWVQAPNFKRLAEAFPAFPGQYIQFGILSDQWPED